MRALSPPIPLTVGVSTPVPLQDHEAWAVLYNESNLTLLVTTALGGRTLPAWTGDLFQLQRGGGGGTLNVLPAAVLAQAASSPASALAGDIYYDSEKPLGVYPIALARQVSIGNQVSTTATNSVQNDGQAAPTVVVEGTPQGANSSQLKWNNDGSGVFGGGLDAVNNAGIFTAMPLDAIPVGAVGPGTLDADVAVPGASVTGTVANATNATNLAAGGALLGNATIPRGDFLEDASATSTQLGVAGDGTALVSSNLSEAHIGSDIATRARYNALRHADGNDYRYGNDAANPSIDFFLTAAQEHWFQHRFAAAGAAGSLIAWMTSGFTMIQQGISGSASATVSHGLNFVPFCVLVNTFNGSNSTTFGSGSYTSTSVFVFEFNSQAWRGFVAA